MINLKLNIHSIEYAIDRGKPIIHLFGRDKNNVRHEVTYKNFKPYFFVLKDEKTIVTKNVDFI